MDHSRQKASHAVDGASAPGGPAEEIGRESADRATPSAIGRAVRGLKLLRQVCPQDSVESPADWFAAMDAEGGDRASSENANVLLDRYEIVRSLGQGGFATVLLAHDRQLKRNVAIKIPRPDILLCARMQQRFLAEAEAVAALEHAGILPVYDAGVTGTRWYIVMAYCQGPSLAEWFDSRNRTIEAELAAEIVAAIAEVVQYAHFRGILHRDIKPSNVLLEPLSNGVNTAFPFQAKLADFGLARRVDRKGGLTQEDAILGSPHYMAPEQAAANHHEVGVATDVYALGAMLYELLTGSPPFAQHTGAARCLAVQEESPASIRRLRPAAPRDLEAICLKCLEKRPRDRYQSAQQLGEDLQRFLRHEPVQVRAVGVAGWTLRWARRRPIIAGLSSALAVTIVGASLALAALWRDEHAARVESERLRDLAEQREAIAERAANELYTVVAEESFRNIPEGDRVREVLLAKALSFYEQWAAEEADSPKRKFQLSRALNQMANVHTLLGHQRECVATRERCLVVLEDLLTADSRNPEYRFDHFYNSMVLANEIGTLGDQKKSHQLTIAAFQEIQRLVADYPESFDYRDALLAASHHVAVVYENTDRHAMARDLYVGATADARRMVNDYPREPSPRKHLAIFCSRLTRHAASSSEREAAVRRQRESIDLLRDGLDLPTAVPELRECLVDVLRDHAVALSSLGRYDDAIAAIDEALQFTAALQLAHPERPSLRMLELTLQRRLGGVTFKAGRLDASEAAFRKSLALADVLRVELPTDVGIPLSMLEILEHCPVEQLRDPDRAARLRAELETIAPSPDPVADF